jgi:AraC-like DNA-binding protein
MMRLTPRTFQRAFKKVFRQTFKSARTYFAMRAAAKMLCSTRCLSIKEVWVSLGYADPISFGRAFRKIWKMSPSDYRRQLGRSNRSPSARPGRDDS